MQKNDTGERVDPDLNPLIRTLTDCTCRCVLYYFDSGESRATVEELARYVHEHDSEVGDVETAITELHHVSLPRLESVGVVTYDARNRTVEFRGRSPLHRIARTVREIEFDER